MRLFTLVLLLLPAAITAQSTPLTACLARSSIPFSSPSSPNFHNLSQPYNLRLPYRPAAIVLPTIPVQISATIRCAASAGVKVQARSGGHSYGSFGLGGANGAVVVDLRWVSLESV